MQTMSNQQRMEFFTTARCPGLSDEALKETVVGLLKPNRVAHVLGCAETAVELASIWGESLQDAYRAAILHDVTKAMDGADQQALCQGLNMTVEEFLWNHPKTLHQITGAEVARRVFGENDAVVAAVRTHTTGAAGMNTLQKIIYIADYMEPNREFEGVQMLRELARKDLNGAMKMGLEMTMNLLREQGRPVCPHSLAALEDLEKENTEC